MWEAVLNIKDHPSIRQRNNSIYMILKINKIKLMKVCPTEHQSIHKSVHRQTNDSNTVSGYDFRGWSQQESSEYFLNN